MKPQLLNTLSRNEEALAGSSGPSSGLSGPFYKTDNRTGNPYIIPLIAAEHSRYNNDPASAWGSSGYWTTMYTYYNGTNDAIQRYGYAVPHGSGKNNYSYATHNSGSPHQLIYAKGKSVGMASSHSPGGGSNTSYIGFLTGLMFIKNPTTSNQTVTIYNRYATRWQSGHDGSSCTVYTPNTNNKSSTTSVSIGMVWSNTGNNDLRNAQGNISILAGQTVAVVVANSHRHHTAYGNGTHNTAYQYWNDLDITFSSGCMPDYNMYATVMMATNRNRSSYITNTSEIAGDWKRCHDIFGD